jgi:hypothetical protein
MASVSVYGGNSQKLSLCVPSERVGNVTAMSLPNRALPLNGPRSLRLRRLVGTTQAIALVDVWATTVPSRNV